MLPVERYIKDEVKIMTKIITTIERKGLSRKRLSEMSIEELEINRRLIDAEIENRNKDDGMEGLGALFG